MALADIRQPSDLRPLTLPQLEDLAAEIREFVSVQFRKPADT